MIRPEVNRAWKVVNRRSTNPLGQVRASVKSCCLPAPLPDSLRAARPPTATEQDDSAGAVHVRVRVRARARLCLSYF